MRKKFATIVSNLLIIMIMGSGLFFIKNDPEPTNSSDPLKFKEEYELLNGKYYESNNLTLSTIEINNDNPIKYAKEKELKELLTTGSRIVYFGYPENEWCRRALPVLLSFASQNKIETIYYYNIYNIKSSYEKKDNQQKQELYESILNILGEENIEVPAVIFIKDGEVIGKVFKLAATYVDSSNELTEEEYNELYNNYQTYYDQLFLNVCQEGC